MRRKLFGTIVVAGVLGGSLGACSSSEPDGITNDNATTVVVTEVGESADA